MSAPAFLSLDDVVYGRVDQVSPLIRRVIAENPSKFTYTGTGTYIIGRGDVVVIDPGPRLDSHRDALRAALDGERVRAILITHCHSDHSPLAAWLHDETGAPTFAYGPHPYPDPVWEELGIDEPDPAETDAKPVEMEETTDFEFRPTQAVGDGEVAIELGGLRFSGLHTPGHTSNHMCWVLDGDDERALFTGDHVMGWSTTVVSPPDGDMTDYIESLRRVVSVCESVGERTLWPTHGPPRGDGAQYVSALVEHRLERERGVVAAIAAGDRTIPEVVERLYVDTRRELHRVARRSVWGHVIKLVDDGRLATADGGLPGLLTEYRLT